MELTTRFKAGLWICLAGAVASVLNLVIENVAMFKLSEFGQAILIIVLTAIISQITKYVNSER